MDGRRDSRPQFMPDGLNPRSWPGAGHVLCRIFPPSFLCVRGTFAAKQPQHVAGKCPLVSSPGADGPTTGGHRGIHQASGGSWMPSSDQWVWFPGSSGAKQNCHRLLNWTPMSQLGMFSPSDALPRGGRGASGDPVILSTIPPGPFVRSDERVRKTGNMQHDASRCGSGPEANALLDLGFPSVQQPLCLRSRNSSLYTEYWSCYPGVIYAKPPPRQRCHDGCADSFDR